jgi:hypothetical protein
MRRGNQHCYTKYPPGEAKNLQLLAPQRGLFTTAESRNNRNSSRGTTRWASAKRKQQREVYFRNSQSSPANPAEPGDLPFGFGRSLRNENSEQAVLSQHLQPREPRGLDSTNLRSFSHEAY